MLQWELPMMMRGDKEKHKVQQRRVEGMLQRDMLVVEGILVEDRPVVEDILVEDRPVVGGKLVVDMVFVDIELWVRVL